MEAERTVLFADVCDSTGIAETLGNVASRSIIAEILGKLRAVTEGVGGTVIKTIGDEIMCAFPTPMDGIAAAVSFTDDVSVWVSSVVDFTETLIWAIDVVTCCAAAAMSLAVAVVL